MRLSNRWKQVLTSLPGAMLLGSFILLSGVASIAGAGYAYYRYQYPYGRSHCCDKQLMIMLQIYAHGHNGWFPKGESCPEASLSLLHQAYPQIDLTDLLRGKIVPLAEVEERLTAGKLLTPQTCGWHYVEGLRSTDDHKLALFWDKVGLGHNGERLWGGGHYVCFVSGEIKTIDGDHWDAFLQEQEQLRKALKRSPAEE
jgi:hypothetical protein